MNKIVLVLTIMVTLIQADRFKYYDDVRTKEKIRVQESIPITKPYTQKIKVSEECYEDTIEVNVPCHNRDTNSIGIDTLIGIGLGVALGNQVGKGSGRDVAKVGGGLVGGYAANQMRDGGGDCISYETIRRCTPIYRYKTVHKTVGYNNCAYIDGQKYCKRTKRPIKWLRIRRSVSVY